MQKLIDALHAFFCKRPLVQQLALEELEESYRNLLECQRMKDYYENMVNFYQKRITDLHAMEVHR